MSSPRATGRALGLALAVLAQPSQAQQFTTAAEVKPMLDITRANWVSLREYGDDDQLLFTQILAWRCGIDRIRYAVNDGPKTFLEVEPCYEGETRPNEIKARDVLPYVLFPLGSVETVTVWLDYDDGSRDTADFRRAAILSR